jgi:hypothetical protein
LREFQSPRYCFKEGKAVYSIIQTAKEVFNSEVLPILSEWGYSVSLERDDSNRVSWEIGWGDWKNGVDVELKASRRRICGVYPSYLEISGGLYCIRCDPYGIGRDTLLRRLEKAVEAALVSLSRAELKEMSYSSKTLKYLNWCMTRHTTWVTQNGYRYRCTLKISLSKHRPIWRWVCEFAEPESPLRKLCELKPAEEVVNPTEAFLKFSRATIVEALL